MRIAYVCADAGIPLGGVKGASVHLRSLAGALARRGHRTFLYCARTDGGNRPPDGVHVVGLPPEASGEWLAKEFADAGIDAVLERYSLPSGAGLQAARTLGLPFTLEVNAPLADEAARFRGLQDVENWRARERNLIAGADHVVVVSTALREHTLAAGARPSAVHVIPNGVELDLFRRDGRERIRVQLGIESAIVVGFVGSLKPWHGVSLLLDALARLPPAYRLVVVGDGPERRPLEERSSLLGVVDRVVFVGGVSYAEIPAYLAAMDIGAAPFAPAADFYFSPLKVVEYMAAGLPVVASRQGDLPQLIGDAGILYEPGRVDALVGALHTLGQDEAVRARLGRNAVLRAATMTWDRVAARVEEVLARKAREETRT